MILVVCPNLAVDVTLHVETLTTGRVHRAREAKRRAGGKGVNVARALRALGEDAILVGLAGGRRGEEIADGLRSEELASDLVPMAGESRTCTIVLGDDASATVVNERGPEVSRSEVEALVARVDRHLSHASSIALMGSLLPGAPADLFARVLARAAERHGARLSLLDTSGEPLRAGLESRPTIVKPNRSEAEELLGMELDSKATRRRALATLRARGAEVAIVTLGAEGLVLASDELSGHLWSASATDSTLGNPTGAGDALAAGLLAGRARGYSMLEAARLGLAAATASLAEGYGRIRAKDLRPEAVRFEPFGSGGSELFGELEA